jgi:hypothetical protein
MFLTSCMRVNPPVRINVVDGAGALVSHPQRSTADASTSTSASGMHHTQEKMIRLDHTRFLHHTDACDSAVVHIDPYRSVL